MIKNGSIVKIHYAMMSENAVLSSTVGKEPLTFVQGAGEIIPGLEEGVSQMNKGEKKRVSVLPEKGFGHPNPDLIKKVPKDAFNEPQNIKVGAAVQGKNGDKTFQAVVTAVVENEVTLDSNHPYAGKILTFDIEVLEVEDPKV